MPSHGVAAQNHAIFIQRQQTFAFLAQGAAGPVDMQQQGVGLGAQQPVFNRPGTAKCQVHQLRPLGHVNAGNVEHANALALWIEDRRPGAAISPKRLKKMLMLMQPHGRLLGQRRANGRSANT